MADDLGKSWTILALDGVGDLIGDARPGFVVDGTGRRLHFANAAARRFLGLPTAGPATADASMLDARLVDRLARFAARAGSGDETHELLRLFSGLRPTLLSIAFRRPDAAVDAVVVRVETAPPVAGDERPEATLAPLVADGGLVALFDAHGDVVAAEGDHAVLEDAQDDVALLLDDPEDPAVLERTVVTGDRAHDLALVRLGDAADARRLLWIGPARAAATAAPVAAPPMPVEVAAPAPTDADADAVLAALPTWSALVQFEEEETDVDAPPAAPAAPAATVDDRDATPPIVLPPADADRQALTPRAEAAPLDTDALAATDATVAPAEATTDATTGAALADDDLFVAAPPLPSLLDASDDLDAALHDAWAAGPSDAGAPAAPTSEPVVSDAAPRSEDAEEPTPVDAAAEARPAPEAAPAASGFRFTPLDRAVKFVWQMDADHRFTMVSDDLAAAVGPAAADLVGRRWDEVAADLRLDADGAVAAALRRRDTWSGRTVLWPIEGEAARLPVDLAALPMFGRGRAFTGFRGFGTCRAETALPDPTATGLRLAGAPVTAPTPVTAPVATPAALAAPALEALAPLAAADAVAEAAPAFAASEDEAAAPTVSADAPEIAASLVPEAPIAEAEAPCLGTEAPTPETSAAAAPVAASAEPQLWPDDGEIALLAAAEAHLPHDDAFDDAFVGEIEDLAPRTVEAAVEPPIAEPTAVEPPARPAPLLAAPLPHDLIEAPVPHALLETPLAPSLLDAPEVPSLLEAPAPRDVPADPTAIADVDADLDIDAEVDALEVDAVEPVAIEPAEVAPAAPASATSAAEPAPRPSATPAPMPAPVVAEAPPVTPAPASPAPLAAVPRLVALAGASRAKAEAARLSAPERQAFRQIAEALGARIEGEDAPAAADASLDTTTAARPAHRVADRRAADRRDAETAPARPADALADGAAPSVDTRLLDRLPVGVALLKDDTVVHANEHFLALVGYPDVATFQAEGGFDALFAGEHVARRFDAGDAGRPTPIIARDGTVVPCDAVLTPVPWNGGSALMLTVTQAAVAPPAPTPARPAVEPSDAAPRPATAAAIAPGDLGERIRELEAIIDTATDGVLMLDADGVVLSANATAEALFGCERRAMVGRPLTDRLAPESRRSAVDYLDGLARNGVASVLNDGREVIGVVAPEGLIPLFMTIGRLSSGRDAKYCAVLRDITHWKKSEEELTAARRRAEEASVHKSDFLAKISHEIRTPLNAIIGFSELMMDERFGPVGNDRYKDYLRDIHVSGTHIMSLVNDLLDLSKVEAGKMDLRFEAVTLSHVVSETVAMMQPQANRERIIIRSSLPAGVPPVVADPRSMRQVVLNLLSNAIKFTPAGGQVIVSTTLEDNGEVVLRVRDTGYGMTDKEMQTAMEPFRQVHTTRSRAGGTGLGLPLTKALVEANRAMFRIDSTVGQGTLVSIAFPVTRVLAS